MQSWVWNAHCEPGAGRVLLLDAVGMILDLPDCSEGEVELRTAAGEQQTSAQGEQPLGGSEKVESMEKSGGVFQQVLFLTEN